ncbi:MAG: 23S rRNA (pseudouridine(1915)-N(3))-methyltransferase RlmH [Pseudomonadota bacterium]
MDLSIIAVGRIKPGPDRTLLDRYVERTTAQGRAAAIGPIAIVELAEAQKSDAASRKSDEADRLLARAGDAPLIALDERGRTMTSRAFADVLARQRDDGTRALAFIIGGPDGLDPRVRKAAAATISFGQMTLPHGLARIVLAEQIYRATTILTGHPYHRD